MFSREGVETQRHEDLETLRHEDAKARSFFENQETFI
jgi:hypothetical protein